jgi:hypothetical protein
VCLSRQHIFTSGLTILNPDSAVGIASAYGLDDRRVGVGVPVGSIIFFSPQRSGRLFGPAGNLSNGYWEIFHLA